MNIAQGILPFQLIENTSKLLLTSFGGLPLVMETFRALGLHQSIHKYISNLQKERKYQEADDIESFIVLFAAGGKCVENLELLRSNEGVKRSSFQKLFLIRSSSTRKRRDCSTGSNPPRAKRAQRGGIQKATLREAPWKATVDLDSTIVESKKHEAYFTYLFFLLRLGYFHH